MGEEGRGDEGLLLHFPPAGTALFAGREKLS
jgi:hypothetical protein